MTGVVDQGRGLERAESCSGGDLLVRREARVGADVSDGRPRALPGRPAAGGVDVLHDGEVIEELRAGHRPAGLLTELFLSPLDAAGTSRLAEEVSGWPPPESDAEA